jgi:hypothetical protein
MGNSDSREKNRHIDDLMQHMADKRTIHDIQIHDLRKEIDETRHRQELCYNDLQEVIRERDFCNQNYIKLARHLGELE